ncbi:purple acid phosphatase family protein [Streptomyces sp. NPDC058385]|uniref:purple acid phosphatase family protein n=1 Tax=Streptomyces sp. NPDC058385 TaxID=3346473 RepID=UPI00365A95C0
MAAWEFAVMTTTSAFGGDRSEQEQEQEQEQAASGGRSGPDVDGGWSRRGLIAAGVAAAGTASLAGAHQAAASPMLWLRPEGFGMPPVSGLHLQFGADTAREVVVSWQTPVPVRRPRVMLGTPAHGLGSEVAARTSFYKDAKSGQSIYVHHARLRRLRPGTDYVYAAVHDGTTPESGSFCTGPSGRAPFTFTSFGDQGTPTVGKLNGPTPPRITEKLTYLNDNLGSPYANDVTTAVERMAPLFHLINGDLCYANLANDRVRTWSDWFDMTSRSSRFRPWMPAAGNHENELGNGPLGFGAYQTYFALPDNGGDPETNGLWYAFTVGSVRVVSLANDDVAYQDGGNSYIRGYSGGAQRRWLQAELARTRADRDIDWIVVVMHQVVVSTADHPGNGADLGIRQEWLPLFDRYGVDVVVCGHEHHYERSHPIRGHQPNDTMTPDPAGTRTDVVDTGAGTVHMVIGGGGTSIPSMDVLFDTPRCNVITGVGGTGANGKKTPVYVTEDAPWSAVRDRVNPYGFVAFTVDPGTHPGGRTTMAVTYYAVTGLYGQAEPVDTFTLQRNRSDRAPDR